MVNSTWLPGTASFTSCGWVVILGGLATWETKTACCCDCVHTINILICSLELCPATTDNAMKMSVQCVELLTLPMYKGTALSVHNSSYLKSVSQIVRSHYQHSCWQCSGNSLHLTSAHWGLWVLGFLLLETSPHHTTASLHPSLHVAVSTGSAGVLFRWPGQWV